MDTMKCLLLISLFTITAFCSSIPRVNEDYMKIIEELKKKKKDYTNIIFEVLKPPGMDFQAIRNLPDLQQRLRTPMREYLEEIGRDEDFEMNAITIKMQDGSNVDVVICSVEGNHGKKLNEEDQKQKINEEEIAKRMPKSFDNKIAFRHVFSEVIEKQKIEENSVVAKNVNGSSIIEQFQLLVNSAMIVNISGNIASSSWMGILIVIVLSMLSLNARGSVQLLFQMVLMAMFYYINFG